MKDVRERAARALCAQAGNPSNAMFGGKPMWMSYLDEADAVIQEIGVSSMQTRIDALAKTLQWVRANYAAGSTAEINKRIDDTLNTFT